ncbi:MAG: CsgG/HfaB family protein [Gallionellaceae bacterium]|nr:CsgG/HfaB family protein [Gallionellaceae bacterium]
MYRQIILFLTCVFLSAYLSGCATESSHALNVPQVNAANSTYNGVKSTLVVGKFDNRSSFMRGLFSDGVDRLGGQAQTILIAHLQQSNHFSVMDRSNMKESEFESSLSGKKQKLKGADYVITGDVTDFGRKEVGDHQLFGILGRGKTQVAYSKVTLNVVNAETSEVIYSTQGAGEYTLSNREIIGFGGTASYDSTLNGKVLDLAIREAVNRLVEAADKGTLKPSN